MIKKLFGTGLCTLILSVFWFSMQAQVTCKQDVKIYLDSDGLAELMVEMFTDDACVGCTIVEANSGSAMIDCNVAGKTIVARITQPNFFTTLCLGQVIDDIIPDFSGSPPSVEVGCHLDLFESPADSFDIVVDDACGIDTIYPLICGVEPGNCVTTYKTVKVQWQAIDSSGNTSSFMQMVSFLKADLADVTFPDNDTLYCDELDTSEAGVPLIHDSIPITKFCGLFAGSMDDTMFICRSSYMVFRNWTVIDLCDLSSVDSIQIITVLDTMPPQIDCPVADTIYLPPDTCVADYIFPDLLSGVTTNCPPGDTVILSVYKLGTLHFKSGDTVTLEPGSYEVTFLVADDCWNVGNCTYSLEVLDTIAPMVAFCPANDMVTFAELGVLGDTVTMCSTLDALFDTIQFETMSMCCEIDMIFCDLIDAIDTMVADTGRYIRMWWATDVCGNVSDTCTQIIVIEAPPVLDPPQAFSRQEVRMPDQPPGDKQNPFLRPLQVAGTNTTFLFSPNPFSNHLDMKGEIADAGTYIFEVLSLDGRKVWQQRLYLDKGSQALEWDANTLGWPPGPLIIRWISPYQTGAKRILFYPDQ